MQTTNTNGLIVSENEYEIMALQLNTLSSYCHRLARANNWWDNERNVGELLCLIHSEISEAMEGHRTSAMDEHLPAYPSIAVELADAMVRILDLAGGLKLPIGEAFANKLCYNQMRSDHKLANREAPGGKKY